jgi:hypothetical protein
MRQPYSGSWRGTLASLPGKVQRHGTKAGGATANMRFWAAIGRCGAVRERESRVANVPGRTAGGNRFEVSSASFILNLRRSDLHIEGGDV